MKSKKGKWIPLMLVSLMALMVTVTSTVGYTEAKGHKGGGGGDSGSYWKLTGNGTTADTNFLGTTDNKPLVFKTNGAERMRLDTGGNVGIGTTNPNRTLSIRTPGGQGVEGIELTHGVGTSWGLGIMGPSNSNPGAFTIENEGITQLLVDDTNGNVGIGTTTPNEALVVNKRLSSITRIAIDTDNPNGNTGIRLRQAGTSRWSVATVGADGDFKIYEDDAGVNRFVIKGDGPNQGNVGIGTTSPTEKLHVAGNLKVDGYTKLATTSVAGNLKVDGYTKLATTSGEPPSSHCSGLAGIADSGLMKLDPNTARLWICSPYLQQLNGWAYVDLTRAHSGGL